MPGEYPYVPQPDRCRLTVPSGEAVCHIMDGCCKDATKEEREELDRALLRLCRRAGVSFLGGPDLAVTAIDEPSRIG